VCAQRFGEVFMSKYGLIAGINWAIAATAVAGCFYVTSQIFAPIPPAAWPAGAPIYKVEQLKSANEILPSNARGMTASTTPLQTTTTQVMGQQKLTPAAQPFRNESADPGLSMTNANSSSQSNPPPRSQERVNIAPTSTNPPPSPGSENLPPYMRYF
jgi:hypothetical protein